MKAEDYIKHALAELKKDNSVEALKILEQGYKSHKSPDILKLMKDVQSCVKHLENKEAYKGFYENTQKVRRNLLNLIDFKFRTWTGKRTKKILKTFPHNTRFQRVEQDILNSGFRNILDIGCNDGRFAICLGARNPMLNVVGIDIAQVNINKANELNRFTNVEFRRAFAEDVHEVFAPNSFDFVILFEILEHVIRVEDVLSSVFKVLKTDGMVAITVPEGFHNHEHVRHFSDQLIMDLWGRMKGFRHTKIFTGTDEQKSSQADCFWNYITFLKEQQ